MNILAFCLMGIDKHRARTRQWRIPERALFGAALLGGSVGAWAGMYLFHHKTRHWYFVVGMPLILAVQAAAVPGVILEQTAPQTGFASAVTAGRNAGV